MRATTLACVLALMGAPALAEGFAQISNKQEFISVIQNKKLTRFGIDLTVTPSGQIVGSAFGRPVTGAWQWKSGYFCRDLFWGQRDLGPNCQAVKVQGSTIRFISDQGNGEYADLRLK